MSVTAAGSVAPAARASVAPVSRRRGPAGDGHFVELDLDSMYLPQPPTEAEKFSYLRDRRRWIFAWLLVGSLGILYGYVMVAVKSSWTTPALLLLVVMVPPVLVNVWLRSHRPRVDLDSHRAQLMAYRPDPRDTVDIWLPTCGEPLRVLRNAYRHIAVMRWHTRVRVWVLDDAARPEVAELAREFGFTHVVRPNRGWLKKAGNLIHAFGISQGRFGVVFDADFVPRSDFLWETIPYMSDPKVGVVQTAQYFDVRPEFNFIQRYAGSLQEIFFRWIQPARDVFKAAICAGTNVVYRRSAVQAAGGFAQVPIGEDVHSGVKLWWAGYETRYVPLALAKGIAPDTFKAVANQQYRWCRSSMLLMIEEHFRAAPFNWKQRTAFWAAFLYYMSSAALLFTGPFPTIAMLWFFPQYIHAHNYLPMVPALLATLFAFPMMARGWRPTIYRLCTINSACHALAVFHALQDRVEEWVPTGLSRRNNAARAGRAKADVPARVDRILRLWIVAVQALLWGGIALRFGILGLEALWATIALGLIQLYLLAPLLTQKKGLRERRPEPSTMDDQPPMIPTSRNDMTVMMERIS
jgi:cellulose synthase (UDP-forming)